VKLIKRFIVAIMGQSMSYPAELSILRPSRPDKDSSCSKSLQEIELGFVELRGPYSHPITCPKNVSITFPKQAQAIPLANTANMTSDVDRARIAKIEKNTIPAKFAPIVIFS